MFEYKELYHRKASKDYVFNLTRDYSSWLLWISEDSKMAATYFWNINVTKLLSLHSLKNYLLVQDLFNKQVQNDGLFEIPAAHRLNQVF